jgi:hypothetical protein
VHNEELSDLRRSLGVVKMVKSRRLMRWLCGRRGEARNAYRILVE